MHTTTPSPAPDQGRFPGYGEDAPLDLPDLTRPGTAQLIASRMADGSMDAFFDALASTGNCAHPVRLAGSSSTIDTDSGEVITTFDSRDLPFGVLHRPCGNRRASVCPSCSRVYARDTYALIHAGINGGKTVPDHVRDNPLLFVTLTAPSFGHVHGHRRGRPCRPRRPETRTRCPHGRPKWCSRTHDEHDDANGAPLCADCHDTTSAVMWQWHAPELWRRFTIALRRGIAHRLGVPDSRLNEHASIQYAKVAEYQTRGLVHFHALIRLDGPAQAGIGSPAPASIDGHDLGALVRQVVPTVTALADPVDHDDPPRVLGFGAQVDVRTVRTGSRTDDPAGPLTPDQVAGYLAKYSTKDSGTLHGHGQARPHLLALKRVCREMASRAAVFHDPSHDYQRMGKWVHCLGFRGHFGSKSRRYSITLGALRRARSRWQELAAESRRAGTPIDTRDLEATLLADETEQTTQVIGAWIYLGTGWRDHTEEALALAVAGRAREYDQWKAQGRTTRNGDESRG
ncbi:replication initiator [Janibacter hoylei]|uniref:replication initiator n=1 Tax=Janibacter hoylei TaxID=364298 RepID=UPI0021A5AACB|nr:replication initiator [Janibacter hoylei]MCT1619304.1 hypothetical protein [Janibacter hoylei]MCT2294203.1 hypothetical protein [Janibacter hoylei]